MSSEGTRTQKWAHVDAVRYNKAKCKVVHFGEGSPQHDYRLLEELTGNGTMEKGI